MSNTQKREHKLGKILGKNWKNANCLLARKTLYRIVIQFGINVCYHCGEYIETYEEFSIEHKEPWMLSENPKDKFWDQNNIDFSHRKCNQEHGNLAEIEHRKRIKENETFDA